MAEYIEKQALIDAIYADGNLGAYAEYIINRVPAADVVPVRHGRWEEAQVDEDDDGVPTLIVYACNNCRIVSWTATPFCGYCGAKMDGE